MCKIVSGIDDNYVLPFLVMVYSAKVNSTKQFNVTLGYDPTELSLSSIDLISQVLRILEVPLEFMKILLTEDMKPRWHISSAAYSRLLLADQISGLMLWLDSDLICLPGWDSIFTDEKNLPNGMVMSVVRDAFVSTKGIDDLRRSSNESVRIMGSDYFNSGVALIDCDIWKSQNYPQLWPTILMEADIRGFEYADQCVLNFLIQRQVNYLPSNYNSLASAKTHSRKKEPKFLHFAGGPKPWSFAYFDFRILRGDLFLSDIYKYFWYQSKLIKIIKLNDRALGSMLANEKKRLRTPLRFSRIVEFIKEKINL